MIAHLPVLAEGFDIMHHLVDDHVTLGPIHTTKHILMLWIAGFLLCVLGILAARGAGIIPRGRLTLAFEAILVFFRDEVIGELMHGKDKSRFLPYAATIFFFILFCNLLGLVPGSATATGNVMVTLGLALLTFFLMHGIALAKHGPIGYFKALVPEVPLALWPLMFAIEMLGTLAKTIALTIRLFANMLAGHLVLLSILSFITIFPGNYVVAGGSVLFCVPLTLLEIFVAFLQAYIFTFLTTIFVAEVMHGH